MKKTAAFEDYGNGAHNQYWMLTARPIGSDEIWYNFCWEGEFMDAEQLRTYMRLPYHFTSKKQAENCWERFCRKRPQWVGLLTPEIDLVEA